MAVNDDSILSTTKKALGIEADYTAFDVDITMHINSTFSVLQQLGVGPLESFAIEDDSSKWSEFIGTEKNINAVKSYMYLSVRILFDPPDTSYAREAMKKMAQEYEWRLNVQMEGVRHPWVDPQTVS